VCSGRRDRRRLGAELRRARLAVGRGSAGLAGRRERRHVGQGRAGVVAVGDSRLAVDNRPVGVEEDNRLAEGIGFVEDSLGSGEDSRLGFVVDSLLEGDLVVGSPVVVEGDSRLEEDIDFGVGSLGAGRCRCCSSLGWTF
jgi:hypothetical protein